MAPPGNKELIRGLRILETQWWLPSRKLTSSPPGFCSWKSSTQIMPNIRGIMLDSLEGNNPLIRPYFIGGPGRPWGDPLQLPRHWLVPTVTADSTWNKSVWPKNSLVSPTIWKGFFGGRSHMFLSSSRYFFDPYLKQWDVFHVCCTDDHSYRTLF